MISRNCSAAQMRLPHERAQSIVELRGALEAEPPTSCMDRKTKTHKFRCSTKSIIRTISVATQLGLLDRETGRLTEIGTRATDPQKFDRVIDAQATDQLRDVGAPLSKIASAINKRLLHANPPITPTAVNIWSALDELLTFSDVRNVPEAARLFADNWPHHRAKFFCRHSV